MFAIGLQKKKTVAVVVATVCNVLYVDGLQYYF